MSLLGTSHLKVTNVNVESVINKAAANTVSCFKLFLRISRLELIERAKVRKQFRENLMLSKT